MIMRALANLKIRLAIGLGLFMLIQLININILISNGIIGMAMVQEGEFEQ